MEKKVKYFGFWQKASTVSQKLEGPKGEGRVEFPNGDKFEGDFYLNYAYINGSCYVACGRYTFADGAYIERAWINTSANLSKYGLKGVFEVKNADDSLRSITSFYMNKRHGVELMLNDKLEAVEWYEGVEIGRSQVADYDLEKITEDRLAMTINLVDGHVIKMFSGRINKNSYNQYYFETYLKGEVTCPDGEVFESVNYGIRNLKPYDGWAHVRSAGGKLSSNLYKEGELVEVREEKGCEEQVEVKSHPNPIHHAPTLRYTWSCLDFYSNKDNESRAVEGTFVPCLGASLDIEGFGYVKIDDITEDGVTFNCRTLHKGEYLSFENEKEETEVRGDDVWTGCWYYMEVYWD